MYIIKNAFRNIRRSKGRNLLIGCIALVIGLSACLALSIKRAAVQEREQGLADLAITASISVDRQSMMETMQKQDPDSDTQKEEMKERMSGMESLSLDEMEKYAKADSVKDFYYTNSVSLDGKSIDPVESGSQNTADDTAKGPGGAKGLSLESMGDFTFTGYSSYDAMKNFIDGTTSLTSGTMFTIGSSELDCVINKELATLNSIKINDTISFVNPSNTDEVFEMKVVGIYTTSESSETVGGRGMAMMDPANQIYMSYEALNSIVESSSNAADDTTALHSQVIGTYTFENVENYEAFEEEAHALGLSDTYTVTSSDVNAYEASLQPLENLSTYATYFLIVILVIGGVILVVLNVYHIRERKYEIGVLAAIGMNKKKVALQFITEIFTVTLLSILIGTGIGATASVPVTNALLSTQSANTSTADSFTQPQGKGGRGEISGGKPSESIERGMNNTSYIEEVSSATDLMVIVQLIGIGILLTIVSGGMSVMTILRYEPLKILSNRE